MAQGDVTVFDDTVDEVLKGNLGNLSADTLKLAFVTTATTPAAGDALPHFGGTGTTDLSTNQTSGGNVPAGGVTLTTPAVNGISGGANFDSADVSIAANASNPSAARWGILYNSTLASNRCFAFLDLGTAQDMTNGFTITVNASGWFQIT